MEDVNVNDLADKLLTYLRNELNDQSVQYHFFPTPLIGGYGSYMYKFRLNEDSDELSTPLVLRLYLKYYPAGQAQLEGLAQNALSEAGYPAPPVYFINSDPTILGGEFIIMKFMPGQMMMDAYPIDVVPEKLAQAHVALHNIDPQFLVRALTENGFYSSHEQGYHFENLKAYINSTETQLMENNVTWLNPGIQWVKDHYPPGNIRLVINHSDFHPYNILVDQGKISAVLDWMGVKLWEPEHDVATNIIGWTCLAPSVIPNIDWIQFTNRYFECYMNESPLNLERLEYYTAWRCIRSIFTSDVLKVDVWGKPGVQERLITRFEEITGIKLEHSG